MRFTNFQQMIDKNSLRKNFLNKKIDRFAHVVGDLASHLNNLSAQKAISYVLDFMRPHLKTLGLRIRKLSKTQVEIVIPNKFMNQNMEQTLDEGVVISSALFGAQSLWNRNAPKGQFSFQLKSMTFENFNPIRDEIILRIELTPQDREMLYAQLVENKKTEWEVLCQTYSADEILTATISMKIEINQITVLGWK